MHCAINKMKDFYRAVHAQRLGPDDPGLYLRLLQDECNELADAVRAASATRTEETKTKSQVLEEAADVCIVVMGVLVSVGIDPSALTEALDRKATANLTKIQDPLGIVFDENGKVQKGPLYSCPSFEDLV